jgi:hypothetical protein
LIPAAPAGGGPIVLPELTLVQPEPTHLVNVDQKMVAYDAAILQRYNDTDAAINASALSATNKDLKAIDNEIKRAEEESRRPLILEKYEEEFIVAHNTWITKKEKDDVKASTVIATFQTTISPSSLSVVIDLIQARRFRQAWFNLNEHFCATVGGRESRSAMLEILTTAVWNGHDFNSHVNYMTTLFDEVTEGGFDINDEMKYEYLKKSILRSKNSMFNSILEYADYADNHDYASLLAKLQVKASAAALNTHRDYVNEIGVSRDMQLMSLESKPRDNSESTNHKSKYSGTRDPKSERAYVLSGNNPNRDHKCSLCGKFGHLEAKCFTTITCDKCHKKGHPAFLCPSRVQMAKASPRGNVVRGTNKVKIADTFNDKYPKKKQK